MKTVILCRRKGLRLAGKTEFKPKPLIEIVDKISEILNKKVEVKILNQARAEIPKQYLDGYKIV